MGEYDLEILFNPLKNSQTHKEERKNRSQGLA